MELKIMGNNYLFPMIFSYIQFLMKRSIFMTE